MKCSACKATYYCDRNCQHEHFLQRKGQYKTLKELTMGRGCGCEG